MSSKNEEPIADATKLNLEDWRQWSTKLEVDTLFVTVSGAHIYGFPSPDSDVDLRGTHKLPIKSLLGLAKPTETVDISAVHQGLEVDLVSHDVGKY